MKYVNIAFVDLEAPKITNPCLFPNNDPAKAPAKYIPKNLLDPKLPSITLPKKYRLTILNADKHNKKYLNEEIVDEKKHMLLKYGVFPL